MTEPQTLSAYFTYCKLQKNLDNKTLKAYQIDLKQFVDFYPNPTTVTRTDMELYIEHLMERYKASTVKRKIAALKAYYHYLVYEEILEHSPFEKIQLHIRQEILLPRTIDRPILGAIFSAAYRELSTAHSKAAHRETIRNIAVLELLFASGIRVSELCTITCDNLNLDSQVVLIRGKGSKERKIYLASAPVVRALKKYLQVRVPRVADEPFFFLNRDGNRLSEQSVRRIINRYTDLSNQPGHYTPHIRDCLDYGKDPEKTESGKYISAYECDPATVADEFLLAKASYAAMTGREQKKENNVLCYQIRQSFYPGEITPKEANRIGYELAMRWTKGRHAFIVTTHTDKQHIHCHIYYNSTTLDCTRKFRNFWGSSFALRRLSDRLCLENGLSIVENPKPRSKGKYRNYGEWQKDRKGPLSYQDRLRLAIDTALAERPADLDEFLNLMKRAGYEVKTVRGGGISFRLTGQGQERFTRLRASTLGDGYDLQDVLSAIEGKEKRPGRSERKISLAVDIQAKLAAGKGPGYERWAKVFNIKQMAAALAYIQDNNLTDYEQLAKKATEAADRFHVISEQVKQTEQAMKTNAGLKAATVQYAKTRPVFEQYKATKYSRKFLAEHEADLELYRAAQAEMRSLLGGAKLPKMDVLKEEGRKLTAKKKQLYGEYQKARRDMQEIVTIKANIDTLMGYTEPGRKQEKER